MRPINVITSPYPGFATDLQSPIMALACLAEGASYIRETIFDGRYTLVGELVKMGASVELDRGAVVVHGPCTFTGAEVVAHDLRTGIALVLAGLAAEGETLVTPVLPDRPGARQHRAAVQRARRGRDRRYRLSLPGYSAADPLVPRHDKMPTSPPDEEEARWSS